MRELLLKICAPVMGDAFAPTTCANALQVLNANEPIVTTALGITTVAIELHLKKAPPPIMDIADGIAIDLSADKRRKQWPPRAIMPLPISIRQTAF